VVAALATLVAIGLVVFLRRYRGADRTAMALSLLIGAGFCLAVTLAWFQRQFGGEIMTRGRLRGIGIRWGAGAGACTGGAGVSLLAVRWAMDQGSGPLGEPFLPSFLRAMATLGLEMATGLPAYLAVGALVGALAGLAVAQGIGISTGRLKPLVPGTPGDGEPMESPGAET
jgi:hypothetical protein